MLNACGGGTSSQQAGVGTGGSGLAEGTVSGFASVVLDGIEYDDASANVQQDDGAGGTVNADLKLGQRVRLSLDANNKVKSAVVMSQLVGPVTASLDGSGGFRVMGQAVQLTTGSAQSVATTLSGFGLGTLTLGDELEVHGSWVFDSVQASYVLHASRVEKVAAAANLVLVSGVVQSLNGDTLQLNGAAGIRVRGVLPAGVAVGHMVRAWASRAALAAMSGGVLMVSRMVDNTLTVSEVSDQTLRLSGQAARYNSALRTVEVQGAVVQLPAQLVIDEAALSRGEFVSLEIKRSGASLSANAAAQRGSSGPSADLGQRISLKAIASGIDWTTTPVRFNLRGVDVQADTSVVSSVCRDAAVGVDLQVEVNGVLATSGDSVVASEVKCAPVSGSTGRVIVEREGTAAQFNLQTSSFTLQTLQGNVTVQWDAQTYFPSEYLNHPESLTGLSVEVEGVNETGVLRARKVRPSH